MLLFFFTEKLKVPVTKEKCGDLAEKCIYIKKADIKSALDKSNLLSESYELQIDSQHITVGLIIFYVLWLLFCRDSLSIYVFIVS